MKETTRENVMLTPDHIAALDGRLLRRDEISLDEDLLQHLLSENLMKAIPALKKDFLSVKCMRCGNTDARFFARLSCARCRKNHLYCRNCIEMGRMMECELLYYWEGSPYVWPRHENPCSWEGELTSAQEKAALRIVEAIENREKEILIWAVCGAGKTEMLFPAMTKALEGGLRVCLATPRADVVRELKPRLEDAFQDVPIQALYGGSDEKEYHAQLVIATTHQLLRYRKAFDVMIIDEVDAFPFHADPSLPFAQNRAEKPQCTTIFLTATPRKTLKRRVHNGQLPHVFVPVRYHGHPLPVPTLHMCTSLAKDLRALKLPYIFIHWLKKRKRQERQLLIFVPTIKLAGRLKTPLRKILKDNDVIKNPEALDAVHASDPDREAKVTAFREKKLHVLITTTILERGVTFPSVDVAVLDAGHDVFDEAALVQIAGRAGRNADDPTGEVVFFHDGKTEAMLEAVCSIKQMNKRGGF